MYADNDRRETNRRSMPLRIAALAFLGVLVSVPGCGGAGPKGPSGTVHGKLTVNGAAVPSGTLVSFISEAGGTASLGEGPFGIELRRLIPVTTPDGEEGYQPSRMWVAEGPRWLLRGIVYGQAAIEDDADSPIVADVLSAFRQVIVRRGDEAMAPGDLLPLTMPTNVTPESEDPET